MRVMSFETVSPTASTEAKADPFKGTAQYYSRFRPGYPDQLFGLLRESFGLDQSADVLDLGCGTGQLGLTLAPTVRSVTSVDPSEDMLQEAAAQAAVRGNTNVRFIPGSSDTLSADVGSFDLCMMGRCFHWMDRAKTLRTLDDLIRDGGGVAVVHDKTLRMPDADWTKAIDAVIGRHLGANSGMNAKRSLLHAPEETHIDFLSASPFSAVEHRVLKVERLWTVDAIIGYLYSTSFCSLTKLGDRRAAFETDLRETLSALNPLNIFTEVADMQVWIARRDMAMMQRAA